MKKQFRPFIIPLDITPGGDPTIPGDGSGQGGVDPFPGGDGGLSIVTPMGYDDWRSRFGADNNLDGQITMADYMQWWADNGFDMDAWMSFNPDVPFSLNPEVDA